MLAKNCTGMAFKCLNKSLGLNKKGIQNLKPVMQQTKIQIGLVESNAFNRETTVYALTSQPDFEVMFAVEDVNQVPPGVTAPDVILFCAWYPAEIFGEELSMAYWRIRMPQTHLVLLTANKIRAVIEVLANQGIEGYAIRQSVSTQALFDIIRFASHSGQALCQASKEILSDPRIETDLTRREVQIIHLLNQVGIGNRKQVANLLGVSSFTINQHLKNIFAKLDVSNLAEVIEHGRALGILESGMV